MSSHFSSSSFAKFRKSSRKIHDSRRLSEVLEETVSVVNLVVVIVVFLVVVVVVVGTSSSVVVDVVRSVVVLSVVLFVVVDLGGVVGGISEDGP